MPVPWAPARSLETPFAINRESIARDLGFSKITANSLDAVSDRDFALDYLFALHRIATHLSRLAEDFVLFASQEFSYVILPTNIPPAAASCRKKEIPIVGELIRGKNRRITGALGLVTPRRSKVFPPATSATCRKTKKRFFSAYDQVRTWL